MHEKAIEISHYINSTGTLNGRTQELAPVPDAENFYIYAKDFFTYSHTIRIESKVFKFPPHMSLFVREFWALFWACRSGVRRLTMPKFPVKINLCWGFNCWKLRVEAEASQECGKFKFSSLEKFRKINAYGGNSAGVQNVTFQWLSGNFLSSLE